MRKRIIFFITNRLIDLRLDTVPREHPVYLVVLSVLCSHTVPSLPVARSTEVYVVEHNVVRVT